MESFDAIVIGGGVIGTSVAYHLGRYGARHVLLLEREQLGSGTTAQSSCVLRTHYSVPENVALAKAALRVFGDFAGYLGDGEADCGFNRCGLMIVAPDGERAAALRETLAIERSFGVDAREIDVAEARHIHPLLAFDDIAAIGCEPDGGYADAYLTLSAFARAARRRGVTIREGVGVTGLLREGHRITGVRTPRGPVTAGAIVSVQNIWSHELTTWTGIAVPLELSRHAVLTFGCATPYARTLPVVLDLAAAGKNYFRSYGDAEVLVGEGTEGETIAEPSTEQANVPLDHVATIRSEFARRVPAFADAGVAKSWTGLYDVTPDWNPVLGAIPGIEGLFVAFGFSGHGFKLSPIVGRLVAQAALGMPTDIALAPYSIERFRRGRLLRGRYGTGAVL